MYYHNKIYNWLLGTQNFIVGRALFKVLSNDNHIKERLLEGENLETTKLLKESMKIMLEKSSKNFDASIANHNHDLQDCILDALKQEWFPLFSKMNYLRGQLDQYSISNDHKAIAAREPIAFEILDLEDQCEAIWAKRDYYLKHGTLPEVDEKEFEIPTDPKELAKLLQSIPRNIRRNRLKMQQPGAKALYAQLYVRYKDLYKQITGNEYVEKD